jgi:hypothetical protein
MKKKQHAQQNSTNHKSSVEIPISQEPTECMSANYVSCDKKCENGSSHNTSSNDGANKYENVSDNGSEISDEGYRSLGLIQANNVKQISLHSQATIEDADPIGKIFQIFRFCNRSFAGYL